MENQVIYTTERDTEIWRDGSAEVLTVTLEYPLFTDSGKGAKRVNAYYDRRNKRFMEQCKKAILPKATACECNRPVTVNLRSKVTFFDEERVSVLTDVTFSAFVNPVRYADVWYRVSGSPIPPEELVPRGESVRKLARAQVESHIVRQAEQFRRFFPDAARTFRRHLKLQNIYLSAAGVPVLFFAQNTIAPRSEGFVQFPLIA